MTEKQSRWSAGVYINRAGKNLPQSQKEVLEAAKDELRRQFDR